MIEIKEFKIESHIFNEYRVCVDCNRILIYENKNFVEIRTAKQNNTWYFSIAYAIGEKGSFAPCMPIGDGYESENKAICKAILKIHNNSEIPNKFKKVLKDKFVELSINKLL